MKQSEQISKNIAVGVALSLAGLSLPGCTAPHNTPWKVTPSKYVSGQIEKVSEYSERYDIMAISVRLDDGRLIKLELYDNERWRFPAEQGTVTVKNLSLELGIGVLISFPTEKIMEHSWYDGSVVSLVNSEGFGVVDVDFVKIVPVKAK
jgi:hypothetical protein